MRVQIQLRAVKLKNIAGAFKGVSDPYAIVKLASKEDEVIGRTQSVKNSLDPEWVEPVFLDFPKDKSIHVIVEIWDDNKGKEEDALMGKALVNVKTALDEPEIATEFEINTGGILKVHAVPSEETNSMMIFQFRCLDVKNIESGILGFGKTDPYLEIAKIYSYPEVGSRHVQAVYRSEVISNHLNPYFKQGAVNLEALCDGNQKMSLQISLWDYGSRKRTLIGILETDLGGILESITKGGNGDKSGALEFCAGGHRKMRVVGHLVVLEAKVAD